VRRLDVLTGPERRRSYTDAQKARLVAETLRPGVSAASVARRHGIHPQQLYTWRRQARQGQLALPAEDMAMFAAVMAEADAGCEALEQAEVAAGEIVIELGDMRLRVGAGVSPERAAALVAALRRAT
jgi:Transposase and inactivated derivatives